MRILILSCNTGEGHNSVAKAIKQKAEQMGDYVEIWDALSFWPKGTNSLVCGGQQFLYKHIPSLFGMGYKFFEKYSVNENEKRLKGKKQGKGLSPLAKGPSIKLFEKINEGNFDAVICAHIFASLMITEYRKLNGKTQPTFLITTDYTCSPGANFSDIEGCFSPSEGLEEEFLNLGVKKELLISVGIPVREEFYHKLSKNEAKEKLGLPNDKKIVLLMSGSMGCGPIEKTVKSIAKNLPDDSILIAICGRNEKLLNNLNNLKNKYPCLVPLGFTKEISDYMDASELIVTKAGGLSSTEAAVKNLPIVFIDAIPGLEIHNVEFFVKQGYARYGESPNEISAHINELLSSPEILKKMSEKMKADFYHRSAEEILEIIHKKAGDYINEPKK